MISLSPIVIPPLSAALPGFTRLTSDNFYYIYYQNDFFDHDHQTVKKLSVALTGFTAEYLCENNYQDDDGFRNENQDHDYGHHKYGMIFVFWISVVMETQ